MENFLPADIDICATAAGRKLYEQAYTINDSNDSCDYEILQKDNRILFTGFADDIQGLPDKMIIGLRTQTNRYQKTVRLSYAQISGKTTDFQGIPFPTAIVFLRKLYGGKIPSFGVWSDSNGAYSVTVPTGMYDSFYVCDSSYGKTSLENWSWNMLVDSDEIHNFKVGNGEVYNLSAKKENDILNISFRPMILPSIRYEERTVFIDDELYFLIDIQPDITFKDIIVTVDGKVVPIISLEKGYEKIFYNGNKTALIIYNMKVRIGEPSEKKSLIILEYQTNNQFESYSQGRTHLL